MNGESHCLLCSTTFSKQIVLAFPLVKQTQVRGFISDFKSLKFYFLAVFIVTCAITEHLRFRIIFSEVLYLYIAFPSN